MDSGEDPDTPEAQRNKKRYHRHTPHQIQELESMFKYCPHPDEKQRMRLSRDLGLEPRQIKFWFQNRRTQMKAQHERTDNCTLRSENDKIRSENIAIREALKNIICPNCGGPPAGEDSHFDEQKLRMENAKLKEELDRVSGITSKYLGRPVTHLPHIHPLPFSSLDLSVGGFSTPALGPSLDLDLLPRCSTIKPPPFHISVSESEKPIMVEMATNAMNELIRLIHTNRPLWVKHGVDEREVLNLETYYTIFPRPAQQLGFPEILVESSRDSGMVIMNAASLVDMFMDSSKWVELFPAIVSKAGTIEILATGISGSRSGSLVLMYEELQVLSPIVPALEFCFLRYCQQTEPGIWVITNVSVDLPGENQFVSPSRSRRLPSGCLIEDMANGFSKVTWVEHMEIEEKYPPHQLYKDLVHSGMVFGAPRWISGLQRMCERLACQMVVGTSTEDFGGVIPLPEGKRSLMKLAQRMMNSFCKSLSSSNAHRSTMLSGLNDAGVRVSFHHSTDLGQPNGIVLSAATSIWLPVPPQKVFNFFRDERTRAQWDVLSKGNPVQEVATINNGSHPGNSTSLLRALNSGQNNMLILQESCTDSWGSLVAYAPVDLPSINIVMSGEDPSYIPLLPSGFTILPDGRAGAGGGPSTSSNPMGGPMGSLVTVAFQILVSKLPTAKLNLESVNTVNNLIGTTVQHIKAALNCSNALD